MDKVRVLRVACLPGGTVYAFLICYFTYKAGAIVELARSSVTKQVTRAFCRTSVYTAKESVLSQIGFSGRLNL